MRRRWHEPIDKLKLDSVTVECPDCMFCCIVTKELVATKEVFCPKCGRLGTKVVS